MIDEHKNDTTDNKKDTPMESFVAGRAGGGMLTPAPSFGSEQTAREELLSAGTASEPNFLLQPETATLAEKEPDTQANEPEQNPPQSAQAQQQSYYNNKKNGQSSYYTPVSGVSAKRGGKLFAIILGVIAVALLGFGGGLLAANQVGNRLETQLADNFSQLLEEAGGAVLYRSVQTDITAAAYQGENGDLSVSQVAELCADSVVEISTETTVSGWNIFGNSGAYLVPGAGSGVIISDNGYILTCAHVIAGADTISVRLRNGETYEATVLASDTQSDVAIIKIEAEDLVPAVFGSSDNSKVGDEVVAIGNPLGELGGSVTNGIISALDREVTIQDQGTFTVMQTNAAINSGNSGGGLFNMRGELIGLVNAKANSVGVEGLAFALPTDDIEEIINDLLNYGYVTSHGVTLGVTMVDISDERTATNYRVNEFGCYIYSVQGNSNAAYAGLQSGDRIISADGALVENADQVVELVAGKAANDNLELVIDRNGEQITLDITLYAVVPTDSTT